MYDTHKCPGGVCTVKDKCYRHKSKSPSDRAWIYPPGKDEDCEFFIPTFRKWSDDVGEDPE